ncbi:MAG: hypothetical protein NZ933_06845 [Bacteroidia bacterium]|nr:hypothetical protein [Bacteroidia bacterium]
MSISSTRKDLFAEEEQLIQQGRLTLAKIDLTEEQWREEYKRMIEAYEKLLMSAKTLTRIADRNQKRLDEMNAELERQNSLLREREEEAKKHQSSLVHNYQKIVEEQSVIDKRVGRVQIALLFMITILTVMILFMLYYLILAPHQAIYWMERFQASK